MKGKYEHGERVWEFNHLAADRALSEAPDGGFVIGSLDPPREFLEPLGPVSEEEKLEDFTEQVSAPEAGCAAGVVLETTTALKESPLAVRTARDNTGLGSDGFRGGRQRGRGFLAMMGVAPERAVEAMQDSGGHVVGLNCGNGIDDMVGIAQRMRAYTDGFLLIQLNADIPSMKGGQIVYTESPEYISERFVRLANMGVNILGGGGTGPEHIRVLAASVGGRRYGDGNSGGVLRPAEVIERYGSCLDLVPLDRHVHGASVGLHVKNGICAI